MPKRNLSESNAAPPLSMEEFILQHEYRSSATEVTLENSLDEYLITVYGRDRFGFTDQEFAGVRRKAEEVIFGSGDDGQYYLTDHEFLNSLRFTDALRGGEAFYLPTITENGELDKENPKVVKCMVYEGKEHLLIMSAQEMQQAEANLQRVSKPTAWQRFVDGFLKIFGSRGEACLKYENFMKHMTTTFGNMRTGWQRVNTAEIANNAIRAEQRALAEQRLDLPEYTRKAQKLIKRNMTAAEFDELLSCLVEEGADLLEDIALAYTVRLNHDTLVARALGVPAEELLEQANQAEDRDAFLLANMDAFLLLIKDLETKAREVDLSAVDALTTMLPHAKLESGQEAYQALRELLGPLDADMNYLCTAYRIEQERQRKLEEEQRQQELKRLEEKRHREENREYYEEQDRKIAEAKRRRDEALAKNPFGEDKLEFYMNDYKPAEEFVVLKADVFLNNNDAVGDFPTGNIISDGFPKENDFGDGFPEENNFGDGFSEENNFGGMNNNAKPKEDIVDSEAYVPSNNPQANTNPFDMPLSNPFDKPLSNPFDDPKYNIFDTAPKKPVKNPIQKPIEGAPQETNPDPFATNVFGDNPFGDGEFGNNPFYNTQQTEQLVNDDPFANNPFGNNPFDNEPQPYQPENYDPFAVNPFVQDVQPKPERKSGGLSR